MQVIRGTVIKGHRVASGTAPDSPYPAGTIKLQLPYFKQLGLDLSQCFKGTINIDISPGQFFIEQADYCFKQVQWLADFNAETFSFIACEISCRGACYSGWIYYPHPETKQRHFQNNSTLELLMPPVSGLNYGDRITLKVPAQKLTITKS